MLVGILVTNTLLQGGLKTEAPVVNESYSRGLSALIKCSTILPLCVSRFLLSNIARIQTHRVLTLVLYYYKHITLPYILLYTVCK